MPPFAYLFFATWTLSFSGGAAGTNTGKKLFLTPYIEQGKIEEGRSLARVSPLEGDVVSYSGYVNVDKKCESNMFFWYFPVENGDAKAPVVVWLHGGLGASSLLGLFNGVGPYRKDASNEVRINEFSWTSVANVLFIDNPVGAGYSSTKFKSCLSKNREEVGKNLLSAITQIFSLFPEVSANPLYVAGQSYSAKYIPAVAKAMQNTDIDLQGLIIASGFVDPDTQIQYSNYLRTIGLLDDEGHCDCRGKVNDCRSKIAHSNWKEAAWCFDDFLTGLSISYPTHFQNITGLDSYFDFTQTKKPQLANFFDYIRGEHLRKCIHVGNSPFHFGKLIQKQMVDDLMKSARPELEELLETHRVLIFNGQLDIVTAYRLTVNYIRKMNWSGAEEYKKAPRTVWKVDGTVAGYAKSGGKLTEVLVRNAGHFVTADQGEWALELISKFLKDQPLD